MMNIDAKGMYYRELNEEIFKAVQAGERDFSLEHVNGQRYIGDALSGDVHISIDGTPGNDLGAFMDGPVIDVSGNGQDGIGNTMNSGKILIHGNAGDIVGHAMRGGKILIKGDVGYRVGIHMKAYQDLCPIIVVGGSAQDFLGEYMAGGVIIVLGLGLDAGAPIVGNYCGTGMHGGAIYIRGHLEDYQMGREVKAFDLTDDDARIVEDCIREFEDAFSIKADDIERERFRKLMPFTHRPYGKLYAY